MTQLYHPTDPATAPDSDLVGARMKAVTDSSIVMGIVLLPAFLLALLIENPPRALGAVGPLSVILAVITAHFLLKRDGRSFSNLGMSMPRNIVRTGLLGLAGALGVLIVSAPIMIGVQQLTGHQPDISALDFVRGSLPGLTLILAITWTTAAFGEEMVFRGFALNRLAESMGSTRASFAVAALIQAVIFGLAHSYQGPVGAFGAGLVGGLIAVLYLVVKRNLWVAILTHGLYDTIGLVGVYFSAQ